MFLIYAHIATVGIAVITLYTVGVRGLQRQMAALKAVRRNRHHVFDLPKAA